MGRFSGRPGQQWVRYSTVCIALAILSTRPIVMGSPSPAEARIGRFKITNSWSSENFSSKRSGRPMETTAMETTAGVVSEEKPLFRVAHSVTHRILSPSEAEQQHWPRLEFGWRTISALILGGVGAALSSAGGLGGGGLFVPLFNLLLQFDAKTSVALSNFMILGGSLANLFINLRQHHPISRHQPLIDFDVVLLLQPNMLLGISTGVILNVILPDWVITALLVLTLGYMTIHSFRGAVRRWKRETNQNRQRRIAAERDRLSFVRAPDFHHHHSEISSSDDDIPSEPLTHFVDQLDAEENLKSEHGQGFRVWRSNVGEDEPQRRSSPWPFLCSGDERSSGGASSFLPVDKVLPLAFTWLAFFTVQVLRGSKGNQSILGIEACGFGYWLLTLSQIPLAFGVTAWTVKRLRASQTSSLDAEFVEDGFVLTPHSCTLLAWMALVAGLLGGLLGIGGGMIVNPLLLTVGMIPQVTAGTCASMVFFSSSMSVVQFWLIGRVPLDYGLSAAVLCAIFSSAGVTLVHRAIDKYNRASIIVFSVTAVMGASSFLMAGFGGFGVWEKFMSGTYMGFHNFC